nr:MAG TPA: hypothetical protein [Caudoviricetes sp.]
MDNIRLKSIACGGLSVSCKRSERLTLYPWSNLGYKGLIVVTMPMKSHYRKADGRWATNRLRELSLLSSTLADSYGYAIVIARSDKEANDIAISYADGKSEARRLIRYFQGVVD